VDGECVDAAFEFTDKCLVYHAVALEAALPAKGFRHNINPEMGLPAQPMTGMASVLLGFVNHVEALGREGLSQLFGDEVAGAHGFGLAGVGCEGQCCCVAENCSIAFVKA